MIYWIQFDMEYDMIWIHDIGHDVIRYMIYGICYEMGHYINDVCGDT